MRTSDIPLHPLPPEVKVAIFQANFFSDVVAVSVDGKPQWFRSVQNFKLLRINLNPSRRKLVVHHGSRPFFHDALQPDDVLKPEIRGFGNERSKDHLYKTASVTKVDKHKLTVVAPRMYPPRKLDFTPDSVDYFLNKRSHEGLNMIYPVRYPIGHPLSLNSSMKYPFDGNKHCTTYI